VVAIWQNSTHVEITVDGCGKPIIGDYCICAAPARCLPGIHWRPNPPRAKLKAAMQLQYARITKTAVRCSRRFWPKPEKYGFSVFTSLASDYVFDSTFRHDGEQGILCSYAVGDKADDIAASPQDELKYWIVEDVANTQQKNWCRQDSEKVALEIQQQPWQADHFMKGAYAFYRPGQWTTLRGRLAKRWGRVFFAGEHIADWQGFMEGAVQTGYDAAHKVP
jgi:monoamine oxidase